MILTEPTPTRRSLLRWSVRDRKPVIAALLVLALTEAVTEALMPWAIGRVLDTAAGKIGGPVAVPVAVIVGMVVLAVFTSVTRYALAARLRVHVAFRLKQRLGELTADSPVEVTREVSPGDLATSVTSDTDDIGSYPNAVAHFVASVVALVVVAVYLLTSSVLLGSVVLVGVPLLMWATAKVADPLEDRQRSHRELLGRLGDLGSDIALGLRVLRGIGGERAFRERYREVSRRTRDAGVAVAHTQAALEAAKLLLPGAFLVVVTWLGARLALDGTITPGELVAFYAAAAFLVSPMSSVASFVTTRAETRVAADNLLRALAVTTPGEVATAKPIGGDLVDAGTGLVVAENEFTAVVTDDATGLAARLAGLAPARVTLGSVPLDRLDRTELRRTITLHDADPALFSGTVREAVDPWGGRTDGEVGEALTVAVARDVVDGLPDGLDTVVGAEARSLSGGQRQRIALARAVLRDPRYLVLVEPTSALDTATEIEVAHQVRSARDGRATVVFTTSPAFLEIADKVVFLGEGEPVSGQHDTMMATCEPYRRLVERETV